MGLLQRKEEVPGIGRGWTSATMMTFSQISFFFVIISCRKADDPIKDSKERQAELLPLTTAAVDAYMPERFAMVE